MTLNRSSITRAALAAALLFANAASPWNRAAALSKEIAALQDGFAEASEKARPAVVHITTVQEEVVRTPEFFFGDPDDLYGEGYAPRAHRYRTEASGSGFIFDAKGYVLTNDHVVHGAQDIRVLLTLADGSEKSYPGRVIGTDPYSDIAVVKIGAKGPFPSLPLGDSDKLRVGEWVLAIGSPFGLGQTVTAGILSALHQSLDVEGRRYANLIQTDAPINRGNSGGPLIDLDGKVIGMNTAIYSPSGLFSGIGFALPINEAKDILDALVAGKASKHGWLGVEVAPIDEVIERNFGLSSSDGALVNRVLGGSPALKAGLKRGDVILNFDEQAIATPGDLARLAAKAAVGASVEVRYVREGKPGRCEVVIGQRPDTEEEAQGEAPAAQPKPAQSSWRWEGVEFAGSANGVAVASVSQDSKLFGYLREQDQIEGVDQSEIGDIADLKRALRGADLSQGIVFDVLREGQPLYISVQAAK